MQQLKHRLKGDTGRLAATYLVIIFGLTVVFSSIIFSISASQFDRPLPPHNDQNSNTYQFDESTRSNIRQLFRERAEQAQIELLISLLILNFVVLIGGAFFSYFLARKTLEPIEAAMNAQSRFVSDASHELRTPLTALQVTNEVALRKKKLTLPEAKELIGYNLSETIKLRNLSEALLGLARQNNTDTATMPVSLSEVVLDAISTLTPLAETKRIAITHDLPAITILANEPAITQILRVLLDNAIKYSPNDSTVNVAMASTATGTNVTIKDTGHGIAPQHQARIFDRFYRIDESRSSQNVEGSGLGLSIANVIAARHGYNITLESEVGKGSTFTISLPKGVAA